MDNRLKGPRLDERSLGKLLSVSQRKKQGTEIRCWQIEDKQDSEAADVMDGCRV